MSKDVENRLGGLLGALFAILSAFLFIALIIALFNVRTGSPGIIFVALTACASIAFWLLNGPTIWQQVKQDNAEKFAADASARSLREAAQAARAAHRASVSVWSMPDESLFMTPTDTSLDGSDNKPDANLLTTMTITQADELFALFNNDPRLNWMVGLKHCEARADLMAEIAAARGIQLNKLWVMASDLDRGTIVSGIEDKIRVVINSAGTELVEWNFHVAPCGTVRDNSLNGETIVFDPMLFDKPVGDSIWRQRLQQDNDTVRFLITDRFVVTNPFDTNKQFRTIGIEERNAHLRESFDLDNDQTVAALAVTLRGRFIDELKANSANEYREFMRCMSEQSFRRWWLSSNGYTKMDALLAAKSYFNIPMTEIESVTKSVSPELREHAIKTRYWKVVAPALSQLSEGFVKMQHTHASAVDAEPWWEPNSHDLWAEHGFEF